MPNFTVSGPSLRLLRDIAAAHDWASVPPERESLVVGLGRMCCVSIERTREGVRARVTDLGRDVAAQSGLVVVFRSSTNPSAAGVPIRRTAPAAQGGAESRPGPSLSPAARRDSSPAGGFLSRGSQW